LANYLPESVIVMSHYEFVSVSLVMESWIIWIGWIDIGRGRRDLAVIRI